MTTMKAIRAHVRGGTEVLVYEDAPIPEVGPDELLLEVHVAAITFTELLWDETWLRNGASRTPIIPSHETSGRVTKVGADVVGYAAGDEVFGLIPFDRNGAAAQFAVLPVDCVAHKPAGVDHATASALPLAALTAWQALVDHAQLTAGARVLIHGAAGGVGQFAMQIAKLLGANVTATARGKDIPLLASLGADRTIDFETERFDDGSAPYDAVLYSVPGAPDESSYRVLREGGTLVTLNAPPDPALLKKHGVRGAFFIVRADAAQMEHLAQLTAQGRLSVRIAARFPLEQARRAYESARDRGRAPGKTVLIVRAHE